jgi:hypothetical protein
VSSSYSTIAQAFIFLLHTEKKREMDGEGVGPVGGELYGQRLAFRRFLLYVEGFDLESVVVIR